MRVLMVTPYPPKPDGIGEHTRALVEALRAEDIEVAVLTARRPAVDDATVGVHRVLSVNPTAALRLMWRTRPDIVHYQFAIPALGSAGLGAVLAGAWIRRATGCRLVFTLHEARREMQLLRGPGRWLYRALVAVADAVVVHTDEVRELVVRECGADPASVWLTPLGAPPPAADLVAPTRLDDVRTRYGVAERPYALCFGYLHPDKGIEHLVEAVAELGRGSGSDGIGFDVLIAGAVRPRSGVFRFFEGQDRAYQAELHGAVDAGGLAGIVRFTGFVPRDDVPALFAAARVVVVPFTTVTQSSVLSTASVVGTPAIASDLPGLSETLGDGGILVPPGEPGPLAEALARVMADDDLLEALRAGQRVCGRRIDLANVARALASVYCDVVGSGQTVRPSEVVLDGR